MNGQTGTLLVVQSYIFINFCILLTYISSFNMNYSKCVSHDILMTVHSTKFIIIYLCQSGEGDTIGRHYTKTLCSDFTGNWFFYKEKIKSSKEASISSASRPQQPVTTISLSQILLVSSLFLLSIIFWRKGSIKLFITDKDEFIAEKMC